jgi:hypothetical protein
LVEAQEGIHCLMIFHFLYDSLENSPVKMIQNQLDDINEDSHGCNHLLSWHLKLAHAAYPYIRSATELWDTSAKVEDHKVCHNPNLTDSARAMLAHTAHRNDSVTPHLWPYALRHAPYTRRILPRNGHSKNSSHNHKYDQQQSTYIPSAAQFMTSKLLYKVAEHNQSGMTVLVSAFIWAIMPNTPQVFLLS